MDIRFASAADVPRIMEFIDNHWARGHVLATSLRLMDWQHSGTEGRDCDYVIATEDDAIVGVLGFVSTSRFDPALSAARTVWLTLWKVLPQTATGTGLRLLTFLSRSVPHDLLGTVGINADVSKLYRALGYRVDTLRQWYVAHPSRTSFAILHLHSEALRLARGVPATDVPTLRRLDTDGLRALDGWIAEAWPAGTVPRKSARFFEARFLDHPFYRYDLHAVERDSVPCGLVVSRTCEVEGARTIRIVDGVLPAAALPGLGVALQRWVVEQDAEGADLLESGLDADRLHASGLLALDPAGSEVVVPNYYEPFVRKNVRVGFAYKLRPGQHLVVFKADADQDRPNLLRES